MGVEGGHGDTTGGSSAPGDTASNMMVAAVYPYNPLAGDMAKQLENASGLPLDQNGSVWRTAVDEVYKTLMKQTPEERRELLVELRADLKSGSTNHSPGEHVGANVSFDMDGEGNIKGINFSRDIDGMNVHEEVKEREGKK